MASPFSTPLQALWRFLWRAAFVGIGLTYSVFCIWGNEIGRQGRESNYPMETAALYHRQAEIFPIRQSFRQIEAVHAIWLVAQGMDDYRFRAIVAVEKALETNPNSPYLKQHLKGLKP